MTNNQLQTLALLYKVSDETLDRVKKTFKTVHYHPDGSPISKEHLAEIEVWAATWRGLPEEVESLDELKKTKLVQLMSAGANAALNSKVFTSYPGWDKKFALCTASGIHSLAIPQYIVMSIISLYNSAYLQTHKTRDDKKWFSKSELPVHNAMTLYGKTAGMLGYGSIAREAARQLKAMNVRIIAANSSGSKKGDDGFMFPGTGDADGSIPDEYYSTTDKDSFHEFLSKSDILIGSLPSTPQTHYLLNKEQFDMMPDRSVFVNIGRGDLAPSDDIIAALDAPNGLIGAALDVTDPEPLPDNHPLYSHPRVVLTPHTSGDYEHYSDAAAECVMENVKRFREKGTFFNVVDVKKGY
ncbi:D-isomer specific 2-hydroxyacid dehydrogenase [Kockovaella imperatae]|uniref:D-isomer specific 2-hydroxyacid dehydrogenase n=1 Tax=Kockovaella imperatae TaxID=4999 RepID=A0A1Y1UR12_9TREE|nr:D-isomer specific 2-hydroxyacid dehydrogenase [Kockovaella imperatae]ORX39585.1 D-isomer specific 2-hydroxyacid dehydrogenase [Kockovaella imperatae]